MCSGTPGQRAFLFLASINGRPLWSPLASPRFDAEWRIELEAVIPAGLEGVDLEIEAYSQRPDGDIVRSNRELLEFD